jgi:coenzyme PQQ biosynthesis protein PqqD
MSEELTRNTICMQSEDVVSREIEGELILIPLNLNVSEEAEELFNLNNSARAIYELCDGENTLGDVIDHVQEKFSGSAEEIEENVLGFCKMLVNKHIFVVKK